MIKERAGDGEVTYLALSDMTVTSESYPQLLQYYATPLCWWSLVHRPWPVRQYSQVDFGFLCSWNLSTKYVENFISYTEDGTAKHNSMMCKSVQFYYAPSQNCEKWIGFFMSVCPYGITAFPIDEFSWNLIFEDFSKICYKYSRFIKIWQE